MSKPPAANPWGNGPAPIYVHPAILAEWRARGLPLPVLPSVPASPKKTATRKRSRKKSAVDSGRPDPHAGAAEARGQPVRPPEPHPLDDLLAAEAIVDLVRMGIGNDFMRTDGTEARQESGAASLGHVLYLLRRARHELADRLARA